jgi:luciferase family oxidoreductase group 1
LSLVTLQAQHDLQEGPALTSLKVFSLLDLAPIVDGGTARDALFNSRDLAQHVERLGYKRFWMAEHHNSTGIASAATSVALGFVAAGTQTIRVGAAGVMLPNHSPLIIAEHYGTLESLYPGRIDLGLGRAPGTDGKTAYAIRRDNFRADETFPQDVQILQDYFNAGHKGIVAVPGNGLKVPLWILGSSLFGAQLAAALGLPYLFASHFAPDALDQAIAIYRETFQPGAQLQEPYCGAAINIFAGDTLADGERLRRGMMQGFIYLRRNQPGPLQEVADDLRDIASPQEIAMAEHVLCESAVGTKASAQAFIERFLERTQVDELILSCHARDHEARVKSFGIGADILNTILSGSDT